MKILDTGTKQLTNAEMLDHIVERRATWAQREAEAKSQSRTTHSRPVNLIKVLENVESRLTRLDAPTPLAGDTKYDAATAIPKLVTRLKLYRLTKPEMLQILNLRPWMIMHMNLIIEDFEARFNEAQRREIVMIIYDVLGGTTHPFDEEASNEAIDGV